MQIHFLNHVAIDIGTAKCRALTAPGIAEAHAATAGPPTGGAKRALEDDDGTLSKAQLDRIKTQIMGDVVHHPLNTDHALRAAKPTIRGVRYHIGL